MYLWKLWRESRAVVIASFVAIFALLAGLLYANLRFQSDSPSHLFAVVLLFFPLLQAIPAGLLGWILGSAGMGRNLGEGSGAFLMTRPRTRRYFAWCDWGYSMAVLLATEIVLNAGLWFLTAGIRSEQKVSTGIQNFHESPLLLVCTVAAAAFLFSAMVFGLTYICTLLMKHSRGVLLSAGLLVVYVAIGFYVSHYYSLQWPPLVQQIWTPSQGVAEHVGLSMAIRACIVMVFPVAAQFFLERADI